MIARHPLNLKKVISNNRSYNFPLYKVYERGKGRKFASEECSSIPCTIGKYSNFIEVIADNDELDTVIDTCY